MPTNNNPAPILVPATSTSLQDTITPSNMNGVFAPVRPAPIISRATDNQLLTLQNTVSQLQDQVTAVTTPSSSTAPAIVTNLAATDEPYKTADGSLLCLVSVSFTDPDPNFASADVYIAGYHGSNIPQLVTNGTASPISFLTEVTKETVTLTVVAKDANGNAQPLTTAPTCQVTLNGVTSAPPPPSIASGLVISPLGYSFSFNVEGGLLQDVIAGYNVYRNTSNTFTGATQIQHIAQPTTNQGTIQVQDMVTLTPSVTYFYWVTAVNTSGLESTPTGVGDAVSGGYPQQVTNVSAVESPYKTADGQMVELVAVDFTPGPSDPYFNSVEIWFTGYNGSAAPQLMAQGSTSPVEFLCETTHEVVTVTVVAVSASGISVPFASAPGCTLALSGVVSAPPAPSIAQAQVALAGAEGWQWAFNVLGGLEFSMIQGYRTYHSEENVTPYPPNNLYTSIPQPATNVGTITVQETTGDILYYWVSAVNTAGLESQLTPVPFTYVDPNQPAPAPPSPVTTTNSYTPATFLNGWAPGAHVGWWETQNSDNGTNFGLSHSQTVNPFTNPNSAFYGNQSTAASFSQAHNAEYAGCVWSFSGVSLPSGASITGATLSIVSEVLPTSGPVNGEGSVWYSTNGGNTWTQVYLATYQNGGNALRVKQTDSVTLPSTVTPTQVQVMACAHSHDDLAMNVYEIALSITQSGYSGPGKITGVSAALVGGDVQIAWNALLPTTRTDIASYQVYRAIHGAGYINSYLHDTVTPNGASSYSWIDTSAHDGSWDYYVVAEDVAGNYSTASDAATLYSATSMLYSATGMTVESQQPLLGASPAVGAGPLGWPVAAQTTDAGINYGTTVPGSAVPPSGVNATYFYVRWTGYIIASMTGSYTIGVNSDDGCNLFVGNVPLIQNLTTGQGANATMTYTQSGTITLQAGTYYPIVLEWQQGTGGDECQLLWTPPGGSIQLIPSANLSSSATSHTGGLTGSWWNGTSSLWYPTGGAFIDFNGTHLNKGGYANTNITVSGGAIGGIGTGSGVMVANNYITLGSNGALSGAGGGQVTIGGLGYIGELNANNTAAHVLTASSTPSPGQDLGLGMYPITNFGFSLTASGSSDVYNIWAVFMVSGDTEADQVQFKVTDTTTNTDYGQVMYSIPASNITATFPFFISITGLSAGTHTLQFYGEKSSGAVTTIAGGTYAICQRIY